MVSTVEWQQRRLCGRIVRVASSPAHYKAGRLGAYLLFDICQILAASLQNDINATATYFEAASENINSLRLRRFRPTNGLNSPLLFNKTL